MSEVFEGRGNIFVKVIADSKVRGADKKTKARGITFELTYPRIVHSEFMTHRVLSKNAMSSRAVPISAMIDLVRNSPAMPVRFGANQPGMQDKGGEHDGSVFCGLGKDENGEPVELFCSGREAWEKAANEACDWADRFDKAGYHKQVANRLIEPFQFMRTIVTGTDWNNFLWLRVDGDADPTIYELAKTMVRAMEASTPETLHYGQWHTPYVEHFDTGIPGKFGYYVLNEDGGRVVLTEEEALAISASCCAQVSYRRLNSTKDKALDIYGRLLSGNKVHASPFEHQFTPLPYHLYDVPPSGVNSPQWSWPKGVTHVTRDMQYYSGNLRGVVQHRQLLKNNVKAG